jgi:CubicO group peptidase (beta-lactamase class C family)
MAVLLFAGLPAAVAAQAPLLDDAFVADTKAYLSRLERLGFSGVVLVAEAGEPVIAEGYGLADRERGTRWAPTTVATIGSITKQFTAAGILALQEKGLLSVRDPLGKHFTGVPADKASITLHHLLTHSSGIVDPEGIDDFDPIDRDAYVRRVLEAALAFAPGERYAYSNANFSLLGAVIEQLTGQSYEAAMRELVFAPAGLEETGYSGPAWPQERLAQGYTGDERWGTVLERPMAADGPYWALRANGGIHSTAMDMLRWSQALLDVRVLAPESREALWTPFVDESNGDGESFYGYGWSVVEPMPDVRVVTHNGGNTIFFADLAIIPSRGVVAFLQTNVVRDFRVANRLLGQIGERVLAGRPYPSVPDVAAAAPGALDAWAGSYETSVGEGFEIRAVAGLLRIEPRGWAAYASLHAPPGADTEALAQKSREIDRIVGAYTQGDYGPLFVAYREEVPVDELREKYEARERMRTEEFGAFSGYEVLGTAPYREYLFTVVRFRYARGDLTPAYAWDPADGRLLGVVMRPVDTTRRLYPAAGGGFVSWDPDNGTSYPVSLESTDQGAVIRIGEGDRATIARKPN